LRFLTGINQSQAAGRTKSVPLRSQASLELLHPRFACLGSRVFTVTEYSKPSISSGPSRALAHSRIHLALTAISLTKTWRLSTIAWGNTDAGADRDWQYIQSYPNLIALGSGLRLTERTGLNPATTSKGSVYSCLGSAPSSICISHNRDIYCSAGSVQLLLERTMPIVKVAVAKTYCIVQL